MITGTLTSEDLNALSEVDLVKLHNSISVPLPADLGKPSLVGNLDRHLQALYDRTRNVGPNYTVSVINGNTTTRSIPQSQNSASPTKCKTCG